MGAGQERGRRGERVAEQHLLDRGWEILDRNWRSGHAEVDLVVRRGSVLAFVEVKTRSQRGSGDPLESITGRKRRRWSAPQSVGSRLEGEGSQELTL